VLRARDLHSETNSGGGDRRVPSELTLVRGIRILVCDTHGPFIGVVSMRGLLLAGRWPRRVASGGIPAVTLIRMGFGLVKEIVAGVRLPSGPG
jgi:hypothetical protein